jgi:hypothetical protein
MSFVFPRLRSLLEKLVGDDWLFDRTALQVLTDSVQAG